MEPEQSADEYGCLRQVATHVQLERRTDRAHYDWRHLHVHNYGRDAHLRFNQNRIDDRARQPASEPIHRVERL